MTYGRGKRVMEENERALLILHWLYRVYCDDVGFRIQHTRDLDLQSGILLGEVLIIELVNLVLHFQNKDTPEILHTVSRAFPRRCADLMFLEHLLVRTAQRVHV